MLCLLLILFSLALRKFLCCQYRFFIIHSVPFIHRDFSSEIQECTSKHVFVFLSHTTISVWLIAITLNHDYWISNVIEYSLYKSKVMSRWRKGTISYRLRSVDSQSNTFLPYLTEGCPRGEMVIKAGLRNRCKRVRTPVALLRWLSNKFPWEKYKSPYPPIYGLNSLTAVPLEGWVWH